MRLPASLFYAFLLIFVFLMLFKLEVLLVGGADRAREIFSEAYYLSERMRNEANFEFQLQSRFDDLRESLFTNPGALLAKNHEPDFLKGLPPHSLALAFTDGRGKIEHFVNLQGNTSRKFVEEFVEINYLVAERQQDVFLGSEYSDKVDNADRLLAEYLGCSADKVGLKQLRASRPVMFESSRGIVSLYWDSQTLNNGKKAFFFARFDLSAVASTYSMRSFLSRNSRPDQFCAFYDVVQKTFIADRNFARLRNDPVFSAVCASCFEIADKAQHSNISIIDTGRFSGIVGRPMFSTGILPVVILRQSQIANYSGYGGVIFLVLACFGLYFFVQTFCFGRGMRLTVGRVLLLACLAAIFMPFMMGQSVFRLILTAASESGRLKLERDLHNLVSGIDSGARLFHANLLQSFRNLVSSSETLAALKTEEIAESAANLSEISEPLAPESLPEGHSLNEDLIYKLAQRMFDPLIEGIDIDEDHHRKANAIVIMGAGGFTRFFDRFKSFIFTTGRLPETDPIFLILNLYRRTVERFFDPDDFVPGLMSKPSAGKKGELEQFKFEEIRRHVAASVGVEKVYAMLINFEGLNSFRTSMGLVNFAVFPVWVNKLIRYFCGISWDEYAISRLYLTRVFTSLNRQELSSVSGNSSAFSLLDPVNYIRKPSPFIQAYGNLRGDMLFSGTSESVRLGMLLKSAQRSRRTMKLQVSGREEVLYYVLPGRYFSLYVVGGRQETRYLKDIEAWRAIILLIGTLMFVIFAALAAINVSRSVSSPLEHLLWGISMIEKSDYTVRLKDSREDEFGSISRAFNLMARRLRERDTLGKFVSPAVRRLAANPELFQVARQGTETTVTILFAALEGFDQFAAVAPVKEVQAHLEIALKQIYRLAETAGGEVDKIIGGKLLIVFPHLGPDGSSAAKAAAGLAESLIRNFAANAKIKPVFGINSGRVISGIIGAPAVRMDNTIIGDPVNVAARLCSLASSNEMPVVVSEDIVRALAGRYPAARVAVRSIRGKKQEVEVFSLQINAGRI